jgi:hypothetical protein
MIGKRLAAKRPRELHQLQHVRDVDAVDRVAAAVDEARVPMAQIDVPEVTDCPERSFRRAVLLAAVAVDDVGGLIEETGGESAVAGHYRHSPSSVLRCCTHPRKFPQRCRCSWYGSGVA